MFIPKLTQILNPGWEMFLQGISQAITNTSMKWSSAGIYYISDPEPFALNTHFMG